MANRRINHGSGKGVHGGNKRTAEGEEGEEAGGK